MAKTKNTGTGAFRPLGMVKRWKLHHAYKHLRSHFHSVQMAALREIHQILQRGKGAARRTGRHTRTASSSLVPAWLRKLWGKRGWHHTDPSPVRQAPERSRGGTPIMQAQRQAGRRHARGESLDLLRNPQARIARDRGNGQRAVDREVNVREGRHEGYVYDTPHGPVTTDRPLEDAAEHERVSREHGEYQRAKAEGRLPADGSHHARYINGVRVKDVVPPPAKERKVMTGRDLKQRQQNGHRKAEPARASDNNGTPQRGQDRQSQGKHARPEPAKGHDYDRANDKLLDKAERAAARGEPERSKAPMVNDRPSPGNGLPWTPRASDKAPPLPADQVREAPSRGRSR